MCFGTSLMCHSLAWNSRPSPLSLLSPERITGFHYRNRSSWGENNNNQKKKTLHLIPSLLHGREQESWEDGLWQGWSLIPSDCLLMATYATYRLPLCVT